MKIEKITIDAKGIQYSADGKSLVRYPNTAEETSFRIPDGVVKIRNGAFEGCRSLVSIDIPEGMTDIGMCAFSGCESLQSIHIPGSVENIGDYAFKDCSSLQSIRIP